MIARVPLLVGSGLRAAFRRLRPDKPRTAAIALAILVAFVVGAFVGNWISDHNVKTRVTEAIRAAVQGTDRGRARLAREAVERVAHQQVAWSPLQTNLHTLETASIVLAPFETLGRGGAIEEIDGAIVYASPVGLFGYMTPSYVMKRLDLQAPLNAEALEQSELAREPGFLDLSFRVLDLLAVERSPGVHDLYVSHHRFAGACIELVVSRTRLLTEGEDIRAESAAWEDVFVAEPCVPPKTTSMVFEGNQSGGRMVLRDARTLLLALGDLQFNGVDDPRVYSQDPDVDFGKMIEIDLETSETRVLATGFRNPQGLLLADDGAIWQTEHGPQGGDEINIIRDGANYGWPSVTYGVDYPFGGARRQWPLNEVQGRHDGFEHPVFAFVPSVGISNIVQPDQREFPLWRDHLLVGSLRAARSLYLLRIENGDRVVYSEPVRINEIVRDLMVLRDGRIALLTDEGEIVLMRNAERADPSGERLLVEASEDVVGYLHGRPGPAATAEARGEQVFTFGCSACHSMAGAASVGPPLNGVLGRPIGSFAGFAYSPALASQTEVWTPSRLVSFLTNPAEQFDGTTMPPPGINAGDAEAVVEFLGQSG